MSTELRPVCPSCGQSDRVVREGERFKNGYEASGDWCERCFSWLSAFMPRSSEEEAEHWANVKRINDALDRRLEEAARRSEQRQRRQAG